MRCNIVSQSRGIGSGLHNFLNNSSKTVFIKILIAQKCTKCTNITLCGNRFFIYCVVEKLFDDYQLFSPLSRPFAPISRDVG